MKKILISDIIFDKSIFDQDWFDEERLAEDNQVIEIEDEYFYKCKREDFELIDNVYIFNVNKYNDRLEKEKFKKEINEYENKIVALIRKKYNINQELAILRQRDTKPEEFAEYNEYVEQCKKITKLSL